MPEPATVSLPSIRATASFLPVATNLVAAFLAGSMFLPLAVNVGGSRYFFLDKSEIRVDFSDVARTTVLLIALAVSLTAARQLGWILSAVGMAIEVFLLYQGNDLPPDAVVPILADAVGLHLGGMLAASRPPTPHRGGRARLASAWASRLGGPYTATSCWQSARTS